jgi:xanthine dehydrogenase YagR molybdenum-binding subunit
MRFRSAASSLTAASALWTPPRPSNCQAFSLSCITATSALSSASFPTAPTPASVRLGQPSRTSASIAVTFEQAQTAAAAVRVQYGEDRPSVSPALNDPEGTPHIDSKRGDSEASFSSAPIQIDETYGTPVEAHNPMEMHATIAVWEGSKCTLYESTQGVITHRNAMAQVLGIPKENLQVISRYIGSGFGNKLYPWPHSALAAAAARRLNRPVKLTLSRKMMFSNVGHRARTVQRLRLGATQDGKLLSLFHDYRAHASLIDDYKEGCGESTPFLYSVPNLQVSSALVRRTVGTPTPMRGPGAVPGIFALESAMDELAIKLNLDPVELRLRNDTLIDEEKRKPFSSRHLKECLQIGAERFGWSKRTPAVGSMRKGDLIIGWGVASAAWGAYRSPCRANVLLLDDGSARVSCATQDIGTGTYTIFAQVVSEKTGIPIERIDVVLGDSSLAPGPRSGGSRATATVLPAIADAANAAIAALLAMAVRTNGSLFEHRDPASLTMAAGRVHAKRQPPESGVAFESLLRMAKVRYANGDGRSGGLGSDSNADDLSTHSFGAQFAEVEWDPGIARLRVRRVVSVIDGGRIINRTTATNQIIGAVVMGVGMALLEETIYDQRSGHPITDNFADYIVPTHADVPAVDATFLDYPDRAMGEYGARGIGEIGLAGVAPAITAAVYHATGVRVRELPVRIEQLLQAKSEA